MPEAAPRVHDANEVTGRDPDNDLTNEFTYTFDVAGNLRTSSDGTTTTTYTHDGWNRLVKVVFGPTHGPRCLIVAKAPSLAP